MEATAQELKDYAAGKLRLVSRGGQFRFIKATTRPNDKGVTPPAKRAYYRVWYLKNRERRLAQNRRYNNSRKARQQGAELKMAVLQKPVPYDKAEYQKYWRAKNRAHVCAYSRRRYRKLMAAQRAVNQECTRPKARPVVRKTSFLSRLFGRW